MPAMTLNPYVLAAARGFVRALTLVLPLVALAAATNADRAWKKAGADAGLRHAFESVVSTTWAQQQELTASDPAAYGDLGIAVALSGDTAMIGAYGNNGTRGAAYVFVRMGGEWTQQQELTASDGAANDMFGGRVSLSGDTAVIAAWGKNANRGAAYVFVRSAGVWSQQQEWTPFDPEGDVGFGASVAVSGDTAAVSAPGADNLQGAVYVYVRSAVRCSSGSDRRLRSKCRTRFGAQKE